MAPATSVPDQDRPQKRICIGTIATAHGVKGLVKILCHADDPDILNGPLFTSETGQDSLTVTMKNSMGTYWLAEIEGVSDRDAALEIRNTKLWIARDKLPDIDDEDEFYFEDLVGLSVEDTDGNKAGKIASVGNFGAGDLLEIKPPTGESYYLPFTKENVSEVDIEDGKIVIRKPENA